MVPCGLTGSNLFSDNPLQIMAAYIDLNPVWAEIVEDPRRTIVSLAMPKPLPVRKGLSSDWPFYLG